MIDKLVNQTCNSQSEALRAQWLYETINRLGTIDNRRKSK